MSGSQSSLLATLRQASSSSLLESNEALPLADSSTVSADPEPKSIPSSSSTTQTRLLMQLLAGNTSTDAGGFVAAETGASVTSLPVSTEASAIVQSCWSTGSNDLSDDLNSVNVTDLFNAADLSQSGNVGKSDVEDQLLMSQLEQAIMNSELSLEDLDNLLAVGSNSNTAPVTTSSAATASAVMSQHHLSRLGIFTYSLQCVIIFGIYCNHSKLIILQ